MTEKSDNAEAYRIELEKLQKKYKEKLRGVLSDAREKYRFTLSELIIKELLENVGSKGKKNDENVSERGDNEQKTIIVKEAEKSPTKSEIMKKTQAAVKAFARTALTKVLIDYVKDVQTLNAAFGENSKNGGFSKSLDLDKLTDGLTPENVDALNVFEKDKAELNKSNFTDFDEEKPNNESELNTTKNSQRDFNDDIVSVGVFCPNDSNELN